MQSNIALYLRNEINKYGSVCDLQLILVIYNYVLTRRIILVDNYGNVYGKVKVY